jgi:hypothetical protein
VPKTSFINGDASQGTRGTRVTAEYLNAVNNHYHTGLDQDGDGALAYAADTGTANAYAVDLSPALTQYITGMPIYFKADNANTGASTINVNGLGIKTIRKISNQDLISGDIQAGQVVGVIYDGTNFQLSSSPSKLATLNSSSLVVQDPASRAQANGIASLDANSRVAQDANTLWDGTAGRSVSTTPAANTIPVYDGNGRLKSSTPVVSDDSNLVATTALLKSNTGAGLIRRFNVNGFSNTLSAGSEQLITLTNIWPTGLGNGYVIGIIARCTNATTNWNASVIAYYYLSPIGAHEWRYAEQKDPITNALPSAFTSADLTTLQPLDLRIKVKNHDTVAKTLIYNIEFLVV